MAVADRPPASGRTAQQPDNPQLPTAYCLLPTVYLVGAGPGDPDLITVKGLRCLRRADVVVYDRLIDPALLDEARPDAARIFVGKGPGYHTMPQEQINALLVAQARQGRVVVRLKGGDPFVFGRGGEEAAALAAAGIPFEVVPGVSAAIAVPAYAGIPVTHRGHGSLMTVVTAHECAPAAGVDWEALARAGGTLIIMMGVAALPRVTQRLREGGLAPHTPAAVIEQGTTAQQRVVEGTLADIAERAAAADIRPPAITVVGAVAALRASLAWFETASRQRTCAPV
jgi:uroporphyrin-III C-methyltransferase